MSGHSKWSQIKRQKGAADVKKGVVFTKMTREIMLAAREGGGLSLDEYLARGRFPINDFRYLDRSRTKILVDRIVRFENLLAELGKIFAQLNIPFDGTLGVAAKSEYRADRRPYQEVFNEQQRRIVEKAFAKEIELHGYRFEA